MDVQFGRTAEDYGRYRSGFPDALFPQLASLGVGLAGQRVLDVGSGTGTLARSFALRGCTVTGLDPAREMLDEARRLDSEAGVSTEYVEGRAESTGLPGTSFDVVSAGQCWHWFDKPEASREASRLLVPGGVLLVAHYDWIPVPGNVVEATERLIERHNPAWKLGGGYGIHGEWCPDIEAAGFEQLETFSFDEPAVYSHEAWRGRIRASAGVGASLAADAVVAFDRELATMLAERFPEDPLAVHHRAWALVARRPE
jgi:SAM-dependent methyltransferase